jgi:formylglycine-generating enzyme required for sulfatase activity
LSKRLGLAEDEVVRLPTEWEWQWVAQAGAQAQEYPWRGEWNMMRANSDESGIGRTTAVGMYPLGAPECWPSWILPERLGMVSEPYEKSGSAGSNPDVSRVLRGGAWATSDPRDCRAADRSVSAPDSRLNHIGFRVCRGAPIEPLPAAPLDTVPLPR